MRSFALASAPSVRPCGLGPLNKERTKRITGDYFWDVPVLLRISRPWGSNAASDMDRFRGHVDLGLTP